MNDTWYDMGLDADMDWMYNHKGKKNGVEGEKIMHNTFYEKMPEDFINAVVTIMEYCQNEDCDDDCSRCPHPLSEIRCGDRGHIIDILHDTILNGTLIPDNATNGDVVKTLFSNTLDNFCERTTWEWNRWWNAPYQEGAIRNDLRGV